MLLSEGRLGEPGQRHLATRPALWTVLSPIQVLAQIYLYERKFANLMEAEKAESVYVKVLPKKLDEEVAKDMVEGFGGVITKLTPTQAKYINVKVDGPFKPEAYKY